MPVELLGKGNYGLQFFALLINYKLLILGFSCFLFIWLQIGAFDDPDVIHVEGEVEPIRDLDIISEELRLKDVETLTKALDKLEKVAKGGQSNDKKVRPEYVSIITNQYWHDLTQHKPTLYITFYLF